MAKDYYLGLDMGTSSVGWAVTDEKYNLIRAKGKDLWGVRLFNEAETSAKRRTFRTSRRRLQREKVRIGCLKELFANEINKVDAGFYARLEDSKYYAEDKREQQPFALFADNGYTDKEYYEDYPTIFHLRKELIKNKKCSYDVRLVFLALLNMFKHRGHFLNANLKGDGIGDLSEIYDSFYESVEEIFEIKLPYDDFRLILEEVLPSSNYSNSKKVEEIIQRAGINKSKHKSFVELIKLICGLSGKISTIFENENYDEDGRKFAISYRDGNYEDKEQKVEELLSCESFQFFTVLKQIHDWGILANIMKGNGKTYKYLSYARVDLYEKHKYDLSVLKKLYKDFAADEYNAMFREMSDNSYSAYIGSVNSKNGTIRRGVKVDSKTFFDKIKKNVLLMPDCQEKEYVLNEIDKESFLPKQLTSSNGVIPYQVHLIELKAILANAETYLEFLKIKDETGLTVSEKIMQLFEFQIPYYVGPLFNNEKGNAWVERKESGKVFPWNFEKKIDVKISAEKFIDKMVNHCTYISGERVLPKNSLLYERFMVLNELNNLKINGEDISVELKQDLYNSLFKKGKKVKRKDIEEHLKCNGYVDKDEEIVISGIDVDFANTLSNYAKFASIIGADTLTYEQEKMAENIILWSTVYGDSKKFLKEKIEENYKDTLTPEQVKRILGFKFKDWGRLSKELLELEGADRTTGELSTIISRMWNENYNFMELLSSNFTYKEEIEKKSNNLEKTLTEIECEDLDELYISAPVKRMIWQTILVIKELNKVLGDVPKKIFVEMARDVNAPKERKDSRKKKFKELYKNCKDDGINWSKEIDETADSLFNSKKLYLYYTQKGRCMYSGERIELSDLFNDNLYDIDHIYPRHFVKDDSIENNLVLVKKEINNAKQDNLLDANIRSKMMGWWKSLADGQFITEEKLKRLTRIDEFSDEERAAFVNRQIVETRQGTKVITHLLERTSDKTEVIYVKAGNVSDFRKKFDLIKCRDINDFHHAKDAYLNIVVGNTYNTKFTKNPINFVKEYNKAPDKNPYHMDKIFNYTVQRNGVVAWNTKNNDSINIVKRMMGRNTPLVTRMNYEEHGGFADQTIYSAEDAKAAEGIGYLPIKSTDEKLNNTLKYGGFKKYTGAYFFLVEFIQKKKRVRTLEAVPLYMKDKLQTTEQLEKYCIDKLGYENPSVRLTKIKMYSLIKVDGFYLYLTGRGGNQLLVSNAVELVIDYENSKYIKKIAELTEKKLKPEEYDKYGIDTTANLKIYDLLMDKHTNAIYAKRPNQVGKKLMEKREEFIELDIDRQLFVIKQILQLSNLTNMGANLVDIGLVKNTGTMKLNKKISDRQEFFLINQSVTGLYENTIDLLTV